MADPLVYILLSFTKNDELAIGTLEAIAVPKDFHDESFLHQLEQLRAFVGTKKESSATQKRGTGQKSIPPPHNLPTENSSKVTRKTMNIFEADMEGLGCHLITGRDEDKTNDDDEYDDSSSYVDDHADYQKENSTSESEDEDVIPASPPLPPAKRKRADQCVKSVSKTVSKKNASHSKENDSFVTPNRSKKSSANNSDYHILTSLDVNIFDTPPSSETKITAKGNSRRMLEQTKEPVNAELHQQHLRSEYKDEIQELKNQISFLNEQIRDSTIDLEIERDDHNNKIVEKDAIILSLQEEIKSLKELNPQTLAKSLNEGLALLHTTLETLTIIQVTSQQSRYQLERSESGRRTNLVKLHKDNETTIHQNALATAISYGKAGSKKRDMSKMINIIMEALWDREFMSKHSLTGKKAPTDKTNNPAKPALPKEDVQAMTSFVVEYWGTKHKLAIDPSMIHPCITSKLLSEHTAFKSREKLFVENADEVDPQ